MFTGIVEEIGEVVSIKGIRGNLELAISCSFLDEIKIDQSISHNGACLTVTGINFEDNYYTVIAIEETLQVTNLSDIGEGDYINLERSLKLEDRLDGHIVQGHVDDQTKCLSKTTIDGSWFFEFSIPAESERLLVRKGSICINGVSLTIASLEKDRFGVAIIPYTYDHTTFCYLDVGQSVNIEYDILGKYLQRHISLLSRQLAD